MITNDNVQAVLAELQRSYPEALELCVLRVELSRAAQRIAELEENTAGPSSASPGITAV